MVCIAVIDREENKGKAGCFPRDVCLISQKKKRKKFSLPEKTEHKFQGTYNLNDFFFKLSYSHEPSVRRIQRTTPEAGNSRLKSVRHGAPPPKFLPTHLTSGLQHPYCCSLCTLYAARLLCFRISAVTLSPKLGCFVPIPWDDHQLRWVKF